MTGWELTPRSVSLLLQVIAALALTHAPLFCPGSFAERAPEFLVSLCGAGR